MKNNKILLLFITLTICLSCNVKSVDSIIINAKIYTVNNQNEIAKSIVIKDGRILDISNSNIDLKKHAVFHYLDFRLFLIKYVTEQNCRLL